jgi:hydroxypyruvate isomerase
MPNMTRRQALATLGSAAAATTLPSHGAAGEARRAASRLKQSVSRGCYGRIPLDDLCEAAKTIG